MRLAVLLATLTLAALAPPAFGQQPTRPGVETFPDWSAATLLTDVGGTYPIYASDSGSVPATFPWGVPVVQTSSGAATCCFSMSPAVTLGTASARTAVVLTDADGPDGPGACWHMQARETAVVTPVHAVLSIRPGWRIGVCTSPTTAPTVSGRNIHPPCDADADCTTASAGSTCTAAATAKQLAASGAHIVCRRSVNAPANTLVVTRTGHQQ